LDEEEALVEDEDQEEEEEEEGDEELEEDYEDGEEGMGSRQFVEDYSGSSDEEEDSADDIEDGSILAKRMAAARKAPAKGVLFVTSVLAVCPLRFCGTRIAPHPIKQVQERRCVLQAGNYLARIMPEAPVHGFSIKCCVDQSYGAIQTRSGKGKAAASDSDEDDDEDDDDGNDLSRGYCNDGMDWSYHDIDWPWHPMMLSLVYYTRSCVL